MAAPPSLSDTMQRLAGTIRAIVPPVDNTMAINAMGEDALAEAAGQVGLSEGQTLLDRIVQTLVESRLNTFAYSGGCHRNYTMECPTGWTLDSENRQCASSGNVPEGCDKLSSDISDILKSDFAIKCQTQWPCVSCERKFTGCPLLWVFDDVSSKCRPTAKYFGPCTDPVDFTSPATSFKANLDKARWAAICFAEWPCKFE